jgi:TPR repeat protein
VRAFSALIFLALSQTAVASERDRVRCYGFFHDKRPQEALPHCEKSAAAGHSTGKHLLGLMYLQGLGVPQDQSKGIALLKSAAEMGGSDAQKDYGIAFQHGVGVARDMKEACDWWEKSAMQNNFLAQAYVAGCYLGTPGREVDPVKAYAYLLLSSEAGYAKAGEGLSMMRGKLSQREIKAAEDLAASLKKGFRTQ